MLKMCLVIALLFSPFTAHADKPEFIFAFENSEGFPAYLGNGEDVLAENPGIDIEILRLVEQQVPIKVVFKRLPWKRCLQELGRGNVSAVEASYKKDREKIGVYPRKTDGSIDPSRRLTSETYSLYTLRKSTLRYDPQTRSFLNLQGILGAPLGYSIVGDLRSLGYPIEASGSAFTNLQKLAKKRVVGIITQDSQTAFQIKRHPKKFSGVVRTNPPIKTKPYYFIISHQFATSYPELTQQIWDTVAELRETILPELYAKYYSL